MEAPQHPSHKSRFIGQVGVMDISDGGAGRTTDVIIAGAGPVGLALALDLGRRNIACVVLDGEARGSGPSANKRANAINARSLEYMRRLGIADAIRAAVRGRPALTRDVAFVTSLTGYELARFRNAFESSPEPPPPDLSPEEYLRIDQDEILDLLRLALAGTLSVSIESGLAFEDVEQRADGLLVTAERRSDKAKLGFSAAYLVGCDGGISTVRKRSGLLLEGEGGRAPNLNVSFLSDELAAICVHPTASMYWVVNPAIDGFVGGHSGAWRMTLWNTQPELESKVRADPGRYIAAAAGRSVSHRVVSMDAWQAHHLVAAHYATDRVFLAGDAAHMHPPTGGLGMNTGLGDAANLGWKLAASLQGWGGPELLESYDAERRPLGARVVAQSNLQYERPPSAFRRPHLDEDTPAGREARDAAALEILNLKRTEFFSRGLVLGHTYTNSPAIASEPGDPLNQDVVSFTETAQPGARLPHRQVDGRSLYDLLSETGFTLLCFGEDRDGLASFTSRAAEAGVPLAMLELPARLHRLYGADYILVRPDQHVAWRGNGVILRETLLDLVGTKKHRARAIE